MSVVLFFILSFLPKWHVQTLIPQIYRQISLWRLYLYYVAKQPFHDPPSIFFSLLSIFPSSYCANLLHPLLYTALPPIFSPLPVVVFYEISPPISCWTIIYSRFLLFPFFFVPPKARHATHTSDLQCCLQPTSSHCFYFESWNSYICLRHPPITT